MPPVQGSFTNPDDTATSVADRLSSRRRGRRSRASRPSRQRPPAKSVKSQLTTLVTMAAAGGMFVVAGLPAYATTQQSASFSVSDASTAPAQSMQVDASAIAAPLLREQFSATSPEELAQARAAALAIERAQANAPGPQQAGDDYPWRDANPSQLSPLRYVYRQCVDFVVWRLNRDVGSTSAPFAYDWGNLTPGGGNARQWVAAWNNHGWPVSDVPIVGAVAFTGANHLAYVKEVYGDGTVFLEEYNYVPNTYSTRVVPASAVNAFLYPPPR